MVIPAQRFTSLLLILFWKISSSTYPIDRLQQENQPSLDYEEENVIRYTAGYVTRALTRKIRRSAHRLKQQLILCLNELTEDEVDMNTEHPSRKWVNAIDRGGLKHVSNNIHVLLSHESCTP